MSTNYVFDTEFLDDRDAVMGISIGIVALMPERTKEFYAVNAMLDDTKVSSGWLGANVWPYLPRTASPTNPGWEILNRSHSDVLERASMAQRLGTFFAQTTTGTHDEPDRLWAWFGGFDFVVLARFLGGFLHMPDSVPQYVRDLKTLHVDQGRPTLPVQSGGDHHALHDARWNVEVGRALGAFK